MNEFEHFLVAVDNSTELAANIGAWGLGSVDVGRSSHRRYASYWAAQVAELRDDDAVGLETALHRRFASRRVNMVNARRESYYVTPPHEVKEALLELKGDLLTFDEVPEAVEWRQSVGVKPRDRA